VEKTRTNWGDAVWDRTDIPHATSDGAQTDVAIVGGGLTGASAAYHLAKRGIRCAIFESARLGDGASGRTGGLALEGTAVGVLEEVDSCLSELQKLVGEENIDCDLHLPGCWEIEHHNAPAERMLPWNDENRPVCIARTVAGGVVQPAALLGGIARAAIRLGAEIRENSPVHRISLEPQLQIEVNGDVVRPGHVVIAANAWINQVLPGTPQLGSALTYACATEALEPSTIEAIGLSAGIPFYTSDMPYLWGRTLAGGRVIFGSYLFFGPPAALDETDVRTGRAGDVIPRMHARVRRLHPLLANVRFSASWAGPIAFTEEAVPLLGRHPRSPRVFVAGGYAGHGVALSVRAGQLIARAIAEDQALPAWGSLER
jgi:gamma-glutamylputrescine oxidase